MKKILLSIATIFSLVSVVSAQSITVNIDGETTNISGTTEMIPVITEVVYNHHLIDFVYNNNTGSTQDWTVTRVILNETPGWSNYLCWGTLGDAGVCHPANSDIIWSAPNIATVPNGGAARVQAYVTAPTGGTATYRYYVSNDGQTYLDSLDLQVNSALSINENSKVSMTVAPNPSSDYFVVNTSNADNGSIKIVDVLGNIISEEAMTASSKKINVSNFRNGVYFVIIDSENAKPVTRRIIVRH
ncbi:MAG: T9SS type A sorting domain-containing protein [Flavobacteriales bacterium]|nr:T9SS type A sorting domain-containing protein [Flavobacteriales bacterium]